MNKISIVTPSFNQGKFIEETIKSIWSQKGDFELEHIIADGGSTDQTLEIIRKYDNLYRSKKYPFRCQKFTFKWWSKKDKGQADAINQGFQRTKGEILAWLNSDDTYLPGTINRVLHTFHSHPAVSAVYGKAYFINPEGKIVGEYPTERFNDIRLAMFNFICQPSLFFKKEVLKIIGPLDIKLNYVMDYDLWIRMSKRFTFYYLQEFLSKYRLHKESKTISPLHALASHKECLDTVMKYYKWAPINRVYGYCYNLIRSQLSYSLNKKKFFIILLSLLFSFTKYIQINKGVKFEDVKMIKFANIKKLFNNLENLF